MKSTRQQRDEDSGVIHVRLYSRWMDKNHRLLVVISFFYGKDPAKPRGPDLEIVGINLLDVASETVTEVNFGKFINFIADGKVLPWKEKVAPF